MSTSDSCKDGASKLSDDVCDMNNKLQNMSTADNTTDDKEEEDIVLSVCSNCGKEDDNLKSCAACKLVKYCSRDCQQAHRPQHKKECRKRAAELHDIELFKQPPPRKDCPICFQQLPSLKTGCRYMTCCGKDICSGCAHAPVYDNQGNKVDNTKCPFCRTPGPTSDEESFEREKTRADANDPIALFNLGCNYRYGLHGYRQDYKKALELWHRAGELGHAFANCNIGLAYSIGRGVEMDKKKGTHYYELAAMAGDEFARRNLGILEEETGNMSKAMKHWMIAVRGGDNDSLKYIKELYSKGHATKEDYTKALQTYQTYLSEIKSVQRDEAAGYDEEFRYY